jgi:GNAT superfamily N-acetyltransferase
MSEPEITQQPRGARDSADVREVGSDESATVSALLGAAFETDPVVRWLVRGRVARKQRRQRLFELELDSYIFPKGHVWVAGDGPDLAGACLALPPGEWQMPQAVSLADARHWLGVFKMQLPAAVKTQAFMAEHHPSEPHWYIRYLGVAPERQGQGIGTELLKPVLERCDAKWLPAYLEASSERNAALYERLGFVHTEKLKLPDGGPPMWAMRRPPVPGQG